MRRLRIAPRGLKDDRLIAAGLFLLTLAVRSPFRSRTPVSWDAVGFALGLERFDVFQQQPVPPGYILYEAAGRVSHLLFADANAALVALSIMASAATVSGVFLLGKALFDSATGLVASILMLFSPLAWYYGDVALSYAVAAPLALIAVWLLYRMFFEQHSAVAAAVFIGIIGGFRLDLFLFLSPLWLFGILWQWRRQALQTRVLLLAGAAMAGAAAVWLVPLVLLSGGVTQFLEAGRTQADIAIRPYTVFAGGLTALGNNMRGVWQAALWLLGLAIILLVYAFLFPFRKRGGEDVKGRYRARMLFLLVTVAPALLYFILFQIGQPGYLLVWSGPIVLVVAWLTVVNARDLSSMLPAPYLLVALLAIIIFANVGLFLGADRIRQNLPFTEAAVQDVFGPYSAAGIDRSDSQTLAAVAVIKQFDPEKSSVVVGVLSDWRKLMYFLPDYHLFMLRMDTGEEPADAFEHYYSVDESTSVELPALDEQLVFISLDPGKLPGLMPANGSEKTDISISSVRLTGDNVQVGPYTFLR